jgi:ABC-type dipeptide/oligopeptide/nickel transport system permease subunit
LREGLLSVLKVLRSSRGWGKFRRSRGAMIALWIIAVYVAVGAWVWAMEGLAWAGERSGAFKLGEVSVLGALLPEKTQERIGPRWLPGLGVGQAAIRREDQADFLFKLANEAIRSAERVSPTAENAPQLREEALRRAQLGERTLTDVSLEQLQALRAEAKSKFDRLDDAKRLVAGATKVQTELTALNAMLVSPLSADLAKQRADTAAQIEQVMFELEDFAKIGEGVSRARPEVKLPLLPGPAMLDALQRAADRVRAGEGPVVDVEIARKLVESLRQQATAQLEASNPLTVSALDDIEPAIERLFPSPSGASGAVYGLRTALGTDAQGRSILVRGVYSAKIALQVGVVVAIISVLFGSLLGAAAAYYGGWIDSAVTWLYSTLSSLPQLVLLAVVAFMFLGSDFERSLVPVYVALCSTFWIGPCRVIRGEVLKIKQLEFAQAATVIGFGRLYILIRHVLPNTLHLMFINFSLLFIGAIKSEVILTFLGLGVKDGASWGLMISQAAPEVINGYFWQLGTATVLMLVLVLAFNVVSDALQDAFDPRHVGS